LPDPFGVIVDRGMPEGNGRLLEAATTAVCTFHGVKIPTLPRTAREGWGTLCGGPKGHSDEGLVPFALSRRFGNFLKINLESLGLELASECGMKATKREIFDEHYRVLSVESQSLTIQGVRSGQVLTIVNQTPGVALTPADYPPGKLIALSDPANRPTN
jgi:hypothetical protein